ncbi:hypothetical protein [Ensifer adhaerens]|jgi:hypothetical protein|uniref:hypothetical protein n=1 Tax=Ensifer adhaerens TaxID=106592 RepID=UPI00202FD22D|nr:hypothetical protein [Ensifer adhaerens]
MVAAAHLAPEPVWSFTPDGTVIDIATPDQRVVCFNEMANALSKIARFDGRNPGQPYSVAQHSVLGACAILNEGGSTHEAALYFLHDGHEYITGDQSSPIQKLYALVARHLFGEDRFRDTIVACKAAWDEAIYYAAGLPGPETWTKRQAALVKSMDQRMCRAEALALFGPKAASQFAYMKPPKLPNPIRPWAPMEAEFRFREMAIKLLTEGRVMNQAIVAANRRGAH